MKYTQEQRHKAEVMAFMHANNYFDWSDNAKKAKNGVYWCYDFAEDCMKPRSIEYLAQEYDDTLAANWHDDIAEVEQLLKEGKTVPFCKG